MPDIKYIAVLDNYQEVARGLADWDSLKPGMRAIFFHDHIADPAELAARLAPFTAVVLTRERTVMDAALMDRLPNLKLILSFGMVNAAIDVPAAKARGITVCGTTGGNPHAMPNITWALILGLTRGLYAEAASLRAGGWQIGLGTDVAGKTLGLIGLGKIGQGVAKIGAAFGVDIIAWSQNLTEEKAAAGGAKLVTKEELFSRSDIVSIHLKLSERTKNLVGAEELSLMKPTAYLVNTSRGPIVSEPALIAALTERRIAGAALDVFDQEPLPQGHPFRYLPNVLATPHIGYVNLEGYKSTFPQMVENAAAWMKGAPLRLMD